MNRKLISVILNLKEMEMSTRLTKKLLSLSARRSLYLTTCATIMLTSAPARADVSLEDLKARLEKLESRTIALESENKELRKKVISSRSTGRPAVAIVTHGDYDRGALANQSTDHFYSGQPNTKGPDILSIAPSWEGAYAGINAGYGLGNIKTYTNTFTVDKATGGVEEISNGNIASYIGGAVAGGQFGYNYIFANHIMLGAEADINWADIYNNVNPSDNQTFSISQSNPLAYGVRELQSSFDANYRRVGLDWVGTARFRLGYELGNFLPFVTAGFAYGQLTSNFHENAYGLEVQFPRPNPPIIPVAQLTATGNYTIGDTSVLSTGWAAGAGMEYMVAKNWSVKAEYLYTSLGGITTPHISQSIEASDTKSYTLENTGGFGIHQARIGLNYHPGWTIEQPLIKAAY
jgi:outer membrane immunogenic protein